MGSKGGRCRDFKFSSKNVSFPHEFPLTTAKLIWNFLGNKNWEQTNIDRQWTRLITNPGHLPDLSYFSLYTTFKNKRKTKYPFEEKYFPFTKGSIHNFSMRAMNAYLYMYKIHVEILFVFSNTSLWFLFGYLQKRGRTHKWQDFCI